MLLDKTGTPPKTILRFLFPCLAIGWGIMYLLPGDNIYNTAPLLYRDIRVIPENVWGSISLFAGILSLIGTLSRMFWLTGTGYGIHTILLFFYAINMASTSPLSVFWFGLLGFFQAARLIEICYEKGKLSKGG